MTRLSWFFQASVIGPLEVPIQSFNMISQRSQGVESPCLIDEQMVWYSQVDRGQNLIGCGANLADKLRTEFKEADESTSKEAMQAMWVGSEGGFGEAEIGKL